MLIVGIVAVTAYTHQLWNGGALHLGKGSEIIYLKKTARKKGKFGLL